jgi:DNA (cytosine-5)-methyltransferase 1
MMHISLFSGIGGFELAAEWAGWRNIASCEINEFGRKVLEHYWPDAYHHDDIHTFTYERLNDELTRRYGAGWRSDDIILTGGFPCQPYSAAGKRQGKEDDRHLWPQMLRVIREVRPKWVVGENVLGLVNWNGGLVFDEVQADLEAEGYQIQPYVLPAAGVGAPHRRDRVWFVAYASSHGHQSGRLGEDRRTKGQGESIEDKRERLWNDSKGNGESGPTPDTESVGRRRGRGKTSDKRQDIVRESGDKRSVPFGITPNTERWRRRLWASNNKRATTREVDASGNEAEVRAQQFQRTPTWHNFPTQSPVRGRNDGLPGGLDGITVSKWRNESIKAYGNAIVPQVAYQIFKAIQQYEQQ